jgi:16S rRNA (uracil1498-N3)-methyltransferase
MATPTTITPASAAAHVFVRGDLSTPLLDEADRHHLTRVLRLRAGADVTACDGRGSWVPCRLTSDGGLEREGEVVREAAPDPQLTVAFALTKGERPDLVVTKLTEQGVDRIVPFVAERSVVRWDAAKAHKHRERFVELTRQAAMQSRRVSLPTVGLATQPGVAAGVGFPAFAEVVDTLRPDAVMADMGGGPLSSVSAVLIGPEGGWSPREREVDFPRLKLGDQVLRAETAAITAGALIAALRSDIVSIPVRLQG